LYGIRYAERVDIPTDCGGLCFPRAILPRSGHAINLEEPALFNQLLDDFFHQVEAGRYTPRDLRSTVPSIYGASGKP